MYLRAYINISQKIEKHENIEFIWDGYPGFTYEVE